jgi:hypothetical protein
MIGPINASSWALISAFSTLVPIENVIRASMNGSAGLTEPKLPVRTVKVLSFEDNPPSAIGLVGNTAGVIAACSAYD